jgi:molybdate-binding protein
MITPVAMANNKVEGAAAVVETSSSGSLVMCSGTCDMSSPIILDNKDSHVYRFVA